MRSGGLPSLQNWCDPTTSGWVGSIPTRSRHPRVQPRHVVPWLVTVCCLLASSMSAGAQVIDTIGKPPVPPPRATVTAVDSGPKAPISPRRAFLYSLAVPGSAQSILGRPKTAALFVAVEALAITMARKSANDLREAKRYARDSLPTGYQVDAVTGLAVLDDNGFPVPIGFLPNDLRPRVAARRTHLEDWIATLAFNHLLSGAEAYVSAHLWDLPAEVSMQRREERTFLTARVRW